jgi:hypothetical protein
VPCDATDDASSCCKVGEGNEPAPSLRAPEQLTSIVPCHQSPNALKQPQLLLTKIVLPKLILDSCCFAGWDRILMALSPWLTAQPAPSSLRLYDRIPSEGVSRALVKNYCMDSNEILRQKFSCCERFVVGFDAGEVNGSNALALTLMTRGRT